MNSGSDPYDEQAFHDLTERLKNGSDDAFEEILERFGPYVIRSVRRSLDRRLRTRFDSQDFVQAVWMTVHEHRDRLAECASPDSLMALLVTIAQRKVRFEFRRHLQAEKQNINRERSMQNDSFVLPLPDHSADHPSQIVIAREQWDLMVDGEPTKYREIMELRCTGLTLDEIAEQVGVNERTVRRVIRRLTDKLEE
ncbi:MAG: sigma-70 family RNA polymerase sigma factor [Planctomycetaceae bacterium]|nr:sigma-70 family RNA polymerase sigma factor [Planctomycetaceae bacterium]